MQRLSPSLAAILRISIVIYGLCCPAIGQLFTEPPAYAVGTSPVFLALGDFNGDRKLDLVVANQGNSEDGIASNVSVLLGNGDGTFGKAVTFANGPEAVSVAVGDFNGDGKLDFVVVYRGVADILDPEKSVPGSISIVLGKGDGTFQQPMNFPAGLEPLSVAVGDFNGDGKLDLAVVNGGDPSNDKPGNVSIFLGKGDGTFQKPVNYDAGPAPVFVVTADFNGDGKLDLAVANQSSGDNTGNVSVFLGKGDGTFQNAVNYGAGESPVYLVVGDLNGDKHLDIVAADPRGNDFAVLLGDGKGGFKSSSGFVAGQQPRAVALGDFNGDGKLDLAVLNSGGMSVLLGNGDGTFEGATDYVTGSRPSSLVVADFNADRKLDVAVTNAGGNTVAILLGNGNGTFPSPVNYPVEGYLSITTGDFNGDQKADLAVVNPLGAVLEGNGDGTFKLGGLFKTGPAPTFITTADFNGDKKLDLAIANASGARLFDPGKVSILLGAGDGSFGDPKGFQVEHFPKSIAVGDFNGDGKLDLAVANSMDKSVSILLGKGDGTFQGAVNYNVGAGPQSVAVGDFNGDGKLDLVVANGTDDNVSVLIGKGDGTFQAAVNYKVGQQPDCVAVGDFNGDGKLDLAVANRGAFGAAGNLSVLLGKGDGTFNAAVNYNADRGATFLVVADFDGDGKLDLAVANSSSNDVSILYGKGDGTFQNPANYSVGSTPISMAVNDFNGDKKPDLAVANLLSRTVTILLNTGRRDSDDFSLNGIDRGP